MCNLPIVACGELGLSSNHTVLVVVTYSIERQQLVADIERLTSDKADLLTRLRFCEEDLKTASECEKCDTIILILCNTSFQY